jgi:acetyl/propionyl-CoA carboxylase alpha subunit
MRVALENYVLLGVATPMELLQDVLAHPEFHAGHLSTHFLEDHLSGWKPRAVEDSELAAALLAATRAPRPGLQPVEAAGTGTPSPWQVLGHWKIAQREERS